MYIIIESRSVIRCVHTADGAPSLLIKCAAVYMYYRRTACKCDEKEVSLQSQSVQCRCAAGIEGNVLVHACWCSSDAVAGVAFQMVVN